MTRLRKSKHHPNDDQLTKVHVPQSIGAPKHCLLMFQRYVLLKRELGLEVRTGAHSTLLPGTMHVFLMTGSKMCYFIVPPKDPIITT